MPGARSAGSGTALPASCKLDGTIKVLDFGIAKPVAGGKPGSQSSVSRLTKTGEVLGSPDYMAPEQARAEPIDARADLFSLGSILYEMLTGHVAVRGDSMATRLTSLLNDEPPPLDADRADIPEAIGALVRQCLSKDASDRPASASEFLKKLRD